MWVRMLAALVFAACLTGGSLAHAADRDTALALLEGAKALMESGSHDKAMEICKRALQSDAGCPEAWFTLGQCQEKLNKPLDAFQHYVKAEKLAKDDNPRLMREAHQAAERISPGLFKLSEANDDLVYKILGVGERAYEAEQFETAIEAFKIIIAVDDTHTGAQEGLKKAQAALAKRGDPVEAKLAEAMLAEVWYLVGAGQQDDARKMANEVGRLYPRTAAGQEAVQLLANNFQPPRKEDAAELKAKLIARAKKRDPAPADSSKPSVQATRSEQPASNLGAFEQAAVKEADTLARAQLAERFNEAFEAGKKFYAQAAPGTEGNQDSLRNALKEFARCEALYAKLEEHNLLNADLEAKQEQASMLRYGCMKMTILGHH